MFKSLLNIFTGGSSAPAEKSVSGVKELENFVDYIVRALVDYPDEVRVTNSTEKEQSIIRIVCNKEDIGKVVGKRGKTIMAIRALVSGAAGRLQQKVSVEVMD